MLSVYDGSGKLKEPQTRRSILVVVPGFGDMKRMNTLVKSVSAIRDSLQEAHYGFECIVNVWNKSIVLNATQHLEPICQVQYNPGLWTHHLKRTPPTTASHVAILMDDIDASRVNMFHTLDVMEKSDLDGISPSIDDQLYRCMLPRRGCLSHRTDFVNIFFLIMKRPLWDCFMSNIDVEQNSYGWGMDVVLSDLCNASLGVVDIYNLTHRGESSLYNRDEAREQMSHYLHAKIGVQLQAKFSDYKWYYDCIAIHRPNVFAHCTLYENGMMTFYSAKADQNFRKSCQTLEKIAK